MLNALSLRLWLQGHGNRRFALLRLTIGQEFQYQLTGRIRSHLRRQRGYVSLRRKLITDFGEWSRTFGMVVLEGKISSTEKVWSSMC